VGSLNPHAVVKNAVFGQIELDQVLQVSPCRAARASAAAVTVLWLCYGCAVSVSLPGGMGLRAVTVMCQLLLCGVSLPARRRGILDSLRASSGCMSEWAWASRRLCAVPVCCACVL